MMYYTIGFDQIKIGRHFDPVILPGIIPFASVRPLMIGHSISSYENCELPHATPIRGKGRVESPIRPAVLQVTLAICAKARLKKSFVLQYIG